MYSKQYIIPENLDHKFDINNYCIKTGIYCGEKNTLIFELNLSYSKDVYYYYNFQIELNPNSYLIDNSFYFDFNKKLEDSFKILYSDDDKLFQLHDIMTDNSNIMLKTITYDVLQHALYKYKNNSFPYMVMSCEKLLKNMNKFIMVVGRLYFDNSLGIILNMSIPSDEVIINQVHNFLLINYDNMFSINELQLYLKKENQK